MLHRYRKLYTFQLISPPPPKKKNIGPSTCKQLIHSAISHPGYKTPLAYTEMNSIFYDVLKLEKGSKIKKYFDQHRYVACFKTLFSPDISPPHPTPLQFISPSKPTYKVVLVITKRYGVRATTIEGQNVLLYHCASVLCVSFT